MQGLVRRGDRSHRSGRANVVYNTPKIAQSCGEPTRGSSGRNRGQNELARGSNTPRARRPESLGKNPPNVYQKVPLEGSETGTGVDRGNGRPARPVRARARRAPHRREKTCRGCRRAALGRKTTWELRAGARGGLVKSVPGPSSPLGFFPRVGAGRMRGARSPCADGARCARGTWATWVLVSRGEIELGRPRWRLSRRLARRVLIGNTRDGGRRRSAETTLGEKYAEFGAANRSRAHTDLHTGTQPRSGSGGVEKRGDKRSGVKRVPKRLRRSVI